MSGARQAENVWDYPRPPAVEACERHLRIELAGAVLAESDGALRVLETSHPPTIYVPEGDVARELLVPSYVRSTWCEFKGKADYLDAVIAEQTYGAVAWRYLEPAPGYEQLRGHISFYPERVDAAWLDDERVQPQAGSFYGGWITAELVGPFKGEPGTGGW